MSNTPPQKSGRVDEGPHPALFLQQAGIGVGATALSLLMRRDLFAAGAVPLGVPIPGSNSVAAKPPMFPAKAKSVIYLFMAGAPSHLDMLDYKPKLQQYNGELIPQEFMKGQRFAFIKGVPRLLGSPYNSPRAVNVARKSPNFSPTFRKLRRHRDCEIDQHNTVQSRPRSNFHELWLPDHRAPQHGVVAHLRVGK